MNCMKCGRETLSEQIFCEECLLEMEKYPVKPGTVVLLPHRRENPVSKKPVKRRTVSLEDQVKMLKRRVRILAVAAVLFAALAAVLAYPAIRYLMDDHFKLGQNYNVVTTATTEPTEATGVSH